MRNRYLLSADILLLVLAWWLAFAIRFDTLMIWSFDYTFQAFLFLTLLLPLKLLVFYAFGLYAQAWQYASWRELRLVAFAVTIASAIVTGVLYGLFLEGGLLQRGGLVSNSGFPRAVVVIDLLLTLYFVGGVRAIVRALSRGAMSERARLLKERPEQQRRVLIVGAGAAGVGIVREIRANPGLGLLPIGFVDDDRHKQGMYVQGLKVWGTRETIPEIVQTARVDEIILALPTAPGREMREIVRLCELAGVPFRTVPGIFELIDGTTTALREVQIEDLLRREPLTIDMDAIAGYLNGVSVLVTGAGGSIGSELCRQIARYNPSRLTVFDHSENNVYEIGRELRAKFPHLQVVLTVGDCRNQAKLHQVMARDEPEVVFHAAAHKHVPLMESNSDEVIRNNIVGTKNVLEASAAAGVQRFVLISTDKAANPRSIMGATKRAAEMLVQDFDHRYPGRYMAVRFGNVLGSRGSVVPLFLEQVRSGGPITVTHPDVTRYFMTIPEAVQLVIQAAALGDGGEIFVLDMGEPVKIVDLARDIVQLSGRRVAEDVDIVFTGLRPGEKLHEELFTTAEIGTRTRHKSIFIARLNGVDPERLYPLIDQIEQAAIAMDDAVCRRLLNEIVPEFEYEPELAARTHPGRAQSPDRVSAQPSPALSAPGSQHRRGDHD